MLKGEDVIDNDCTYEDDRDFIEEVNKNDEDYSVFKSDFGDILRSYETL